MVCSSTVYIVAALYPPSCEMDRRIRDSGKTAHQELKEEETLSLQTMEENVAPPSHATANFQKALDAVVPACLVLKYAFASCRPCR